MVRDDSIFRRDVIGWSLYDFANTIYSMNIASLYLKRYIVEDLGYGDRYFDIPFSLSMLLAALLLPALGALSDHTGRKRVFVFLFTLTCCAAVGLLAYVPPAMIFITTVLFIIANFAYEAAQPFYNALLYSVADGNRARFISGFGVALGYVGSIVGMVLVLPFVTGSIFAFDEPFLEGGGKVAAFAPTAVLFLLFSIPLVLWVRERQSPLPGKISVRQAYRDVIDGIVLTRKYPGVLRFLIADYFLEDAVATVIINIGIYCSLVVGMAEEQINLFLIISTISAVLGSFLLGKIAERWSLKRLLQVIAVGWIVSLTWFALTDSITVIWILGSAVGILLGGLWTTTRPLLAELVPREELGRFFGLFALSGRAAAVVGPLVWTTVVIAFHPDHPLGRAVAQMLGVTEADLTGLPYRAAVISLVVLMAVGLLILRRVPETRGSSLGT